MPLTSGSRLGAFEILAPLGAGGMGEVYRARDSRLGRVVAIKVVLDLFASDAERVARFEHEAKVLASLNHPHIAALYGIEEADGRLFLVMELVDGDTLADRLRRGPLTIEEAARVALQIAEALEAAHEQGIVHRDLKPANVKLTADGKVKVLDFGLAKAMQPQVPAADVANSPTFSVMASQVGMIVGTAAYMSPEQAKGFAADHRSDIFSFGVVLYEMLAGRRPFDGDTVTELLASVLVRDADLGKLPPDLHPRFADLVKRCLEKDPKRRWQAIGDVRAELETIVAAPRSDRRRAAAVPPQPLWKRALPAVAAAVIFGALSAVATWYLKPTPAAAVARFAIVVPPEQRFTAPGRELVAIAPDGSKFAYVADTRLYLRRFAEDTAKAIPGSQSSRGPTSPAFSPDGEWIAYFSVEDDALKRIPVAGGAPVTICPAINPQGISWGSVGILFGQADGIFLVSPNGGAPRKIMAAGEGETVYGPEATPDGKVVLFTLATGAAPDRWEKAKIVAQPLTGGARTVLVDGASAATYVAATGDLVYAVGGVLFAVPFDPWRVRVTGGAVPVLEGVRRSAGAVTGAAHFAISSNGSIVYIPGPMTTSASAVAMGIFDATGNVTPLKLPPGPYQHARVSPDGKRVAFCSDDGNDAFIAVYDLAENRAIQRLTFTGHNRFPVWSPEGSRIAFQSDRDGDLAIYAQASDGSGSAERLTKPAAAEAHIPDSWSPDGQTLLFDVLTNESQRLYALALKTRQATPFDSVRSDSHAPTGAVFSPDGRWVAYSVTEHRDTNLFVQPFPATGARYQLTKEPKDFPHHPVWSPDGKALVYFPRPGGMDVSTVMTDGGFSFGAVKPLRRVFLSTGPAGSRTYDMMPDGRFLAFVSPGDPTLAAGSSVIDVVLNWSEELKARVGR